jgi:hypothetical protein
MLKNLIKIINKSQILIWAFGSLFDFVMVSWYLWSPVVLSAPQLDDFGIWYDPHDLKF